MSHEDTIPYVPPSIENRLYTLKAYRFRPGRGEWKHVLPNLKRESHPSSMRIVTWNVDFFTTHPGPRLTTALRHIQLDVLKCKSDEAPEPCCILLQEVSVRALKFIFTDPWVRDHFAVAPINSGKWPEESVFGNVTLVSRSLTVVGVKMLHFGGSQMHRTGLMVDIKMGSPVPEGRDLTVRIINTHLESLPEGAVERPVQLNLLMSFLKDDGIRGGVIAGDMNAIGPTDATIVHDAGLRDAWRRGDADEQGFTWGYQGGGDFPPARLDKVLYLPRRGLKVEEPQRIGVGVKAGHEEHQADAVWTSDHYGLDATLRVLR